MNLNMNFYSTMDGALTERKEYADLVGREDDAAARADTANFQDTFTLEKGEFSDILQEGDDAQADGDGKNSKLDAASAAQQSSVQSSQQFNHLLHFSNTLSKQIDNFRGKSADNKNALIAQ